MPSTSRLRLLLVEDDELFRLGLQVRLQREGDLEIIAEAEDGESAVELTPPISTGCCGFGCRTSGNRWH